MRFVLALLLIVIAPATAWAERRVALVFGADDYRLIRRLDNGVNDARAMEAALEKLGFQVVLEPDRDLRRMRRALEDFREDAAGADVALVFFAGHGVEIAGENRLLPVDADASSLESLKSSSLPLEDVRATVSAVAKVGLIVLDACRNDPFGQSGGEGRGATSLSTDVAGEARPGLGRMGRAENMLFAFAAAPGETAADGADGNSPFTTALAKYLATDGLEIRSVLTLVQQEVYDLSRGKQLPYVESGLPDVFFAAAAKDQLPERERLLLAMADITPELRGKVERIASDAGMPLAPLYGALVDLDRDSLTADELDARLREAAQAFARVQSEMKALASADPEVTGLRQTAEEQLALGAFDSAREDLAKAAAIDNRSRQSLKANFTERTLSEAATYFLSGGAARAQLRYELAADEYQKAAALFTEAGEENIADEHRERQLWTLEALGDIRITTGNLTAANRAFGEAIRVAEQRVAGNPANASWQRDLSVIHGRIGDLREVQGDIAGALRAYDASQQIAVRLAGQDPANTEWQRDLSVGYGRVGDLRLVTGELPQALEAYRASLAIREALARRDATNAEGQRDVSVAYNQIAEVLAMQGDSDGALRSYGQGLAIRERLVAADPANADWQRDLSVSHGKIGEVHLARGEHAEALAAFEASFAISNRLASQDPDNTDRRRDLALGHDRIGDVLRNQGQLDGALRSYSAGHAIFTALAGRDSANTLWQRDLSLNISKIAEAMLARGDAQEAMRLFETSLSVVQRLAALDPGNMVWQRDLSVGYDRIGRLREAGGDAAGALEAFEQSLAIAENLAARDRSNAIWQRDLAWSYGKVGDLRAGAGDFGGALRSFEAGLPIVQALVAADPASRKWRRDLMVFHFKIAETGGDARAHFGKALEIASALERDGLLGESDARIPEMLRGRLARLDKDGK